MKPQAIEWAFSQAAGFDFKVSTDNLDGVEPDRVGFAKCVSEQLCVYQQTQFPPRAEQFLFALKSFYGSHGRAAQAIVPTTRQCA